MSNETLISKIMDKILSKVILTVSPSMKNLVDRIAILTEDKKNPQREIIHYSRKEPLSDDVWFCFIADVVQNTPYLRERIIPKHTNVEVYATPPSLAFIRPNPFETKGIMEFVYDCATKKHKELKKENPNLNVRVLGVSIGNAIAYKFASNVYSDELLSIVPGADLADCIFRSDSTKNIAKSSGRSPREFRMALKGWSPIELVKDLKTRYVEIHYGNKDRFIPSESAEELIEELKKSKQFSRVFKHDNVGHTGTVFQFARDSPEKYKHKFRNPYKQPEKSDPVLLPQIGTDKQKPCYEFRPLPEALQFAK